MTRRYPRFPETATKRAIHARRRAPGPPRNAPAAHTQGFLARDGMPPSDLLQTARVEVRPYAVEIVEDRMAVAIAINTELVRDDVGIAVDDLRAPTDGREEHSLSPLPIYTRQGGLRQAPGHAA